MVLSRRITVWLLLCALVAAQALGLMHRIVHAPHAHLPAQQAVQQAHAPHAAGWVAGLFAAHHDESTCRLFDPLNHEAAPSVPAVLLPLVLASFFLDFFQGECLARWAALYDARGPPSLR